MIESKIKLAGNLAYWHALLCIVIRPGKTVGEGGFIGECDNSKTDTEEKTRIQIMD